MRYCPKQQTWILSDECILVSDCWDVLDFTDCNIMQKCVQKANLQIETDRYFNVKVTELYKNNQGQIVSKVVKTDKILVSHEKQNSFCNNCLRWINEKCTEVTLDTKKVYPNCYIKKS